MKKSLSLILAIAMVFSMFASVALAEEAEQVEELDAAAKFEALVEEGIFQGHEDGEAGLEENMTRAQAAVVMTELFGLDISNPPASPSFSDVATSHWAYAQIEAAADAGIINGRTNGEFDPGTVEEIEQGVGYVTVQELAIMLTLGFQEIYGLDIDPNGTVDGNVAPWAEHYVAAAIEQGLLPANANFTSYATRAQLVEAAYEAKKAVDELPAPGADVPGIASFEAAGAKKLQLVMNTPLDDDADISLQRNGRDTDIEKIETSDDQKEVTIFTSGKLREAEYTVVVETDGAEFSETIEVEDERVESVEFQSEYAPLDRDADNIVYAFVRVSNQYGEDVTKSESGALVMTASPGGSDAMAHEDGNKFSITAAADYEYRIGDRVTVSVVHPDSTQYATASLEVSAPSRVSNIEIIDLYHPEDEVPEAGSDDQDFQLLVTLFDQYGNELTAADGKEDVLYTVDFRYVITVAEDNDNDPIFSVIDIDGEEHIGVQLTADGDDGFEAGTATITLLSSMTGQRDSFSVTVEEESILDVFTMSQPDVAVAGDDDIKIPFEAYDQNGEEITKASKLNDDDKGVQSLSISGAGLDEDNITFKQNPISGKAEMVLNASASTKQDENQRIIITVITQTGKVERLNLTLRSQAEADAVGSDLDISMIYAEGAQKTLELDDVEIIDQYDRKIDMDSRIDDGSYKITLTSSNENYVTLNGGKTAEFTDSDDKIVIKGVKKGRSTVTIELFEWEDGEWNSVDSRTFSFRTVEKADIDDYKVEELSHPLRYFATQAEADANGDYKKEVKVKAFLSNGNEVAIPVTNYYSVTSAVYNEGNKLYGVVPDNLGNGDDEEYTYTVVIYADGGNIQQSSTVTVLNEAPRAASLSLKDDTTVNGYKAEKQNNGLVSVNTSAINDASDLQALVNGIVKVKDQFDVELNNNNLNLNVLASVDYSDLEEGDDFTVTVSVRGVALTFTVALD